MNGKVSVGIKTNPVASLIPFLAYVILVEYSWLRLRLYYSS